MLFDYWSKRGIPPFIEALLKNAPPPEDELPDEVPAFIQVILYRYGTAFAF